MTVLLLRLAGPMQSWGDSSRFSIRATRREPTKSGVLGLLAAAQGRRRTDSIEDLLGLRFGVRSDQPGSVIRDFHTAHDRDGASMPLSHRYYLADATFLAGVEGAPELIDGLRSALESPAFPLYLGRRSCPAEGKVVQGVRDHGLETALRDEPWLASEWHKKREGKLVNLDLHIDARSGEVGELVRDEPISYNPVKREYGWRTVTTAVVQKTNEHGTDEPGWLAALGAS